MVLVLDQGARRLQFRTAYIVTLILIYREEFKVFLAESKGLQKGVGEVVAISSGVLESNTMVLCIVHGITD